MLIELLKSIDIPYKLLEEKDTQIEKIEWYWKGMHELISPKIRFDKLTGYCVMLGRAMGTPLYPNHRKVLIDWFSDYILKHENNSTIKVEFLLDYFDMIDDEIKTWVGLLAEKFQPHQISFKWYFGDDEDYDEDGIKEFLKMFLPFSTSYEIVPFEDFDTLIESQYHRFQDV